MTVAAQGYRRLMTSHDARAERPSRAAGLMFGIGLGGFVDGTVLHQLLQWHHMVSAVDAHPPSTLAGLEVNTMADGFFHVASWMVVVGASIVTLAHWRQGRLAPTWRFHVGLLLVGWGLFDLVEGLVDRQLLGVHHVRDDLGGPLSWDLGFLALGALLVVVGWFVHAGGRPARDAPLSASGTSGRARSAPPA